MRARTKLHVAARHPIYFSSSGSILLADAYSNRESSPCTHVGSSCFRGVLLLGANCFREESQKAEINNIINIWTEWSIEAMPAFTNAKQSIPPLFLAIMENDKARDAIHAKGASMTNDDWLELGRLNREKRDFRAAAEKALQWNTDKGALA